MTASRSADDAARLALPPNLFAHAVVMFILAVLLNLAQTIAWVCAVLQILWMVIARSRNDALADFGQGLGNWMAATARFLTGASDRRPFPWNKWE
jgi:hypothetical protein